MSRADVWRPAVGVSVRWQPRFGRRGFLLELQLEDGRALKFFGSPFDARRWRGDGPGTSRQGDRVRMQRLRCYEWPFGLVHRCSRWEPA